MSKTNCNRNPRIVGTPGPGKVKMLFSASNACDCGCGLPARFEFTIGRDIVIFSEPETIRELITSMIDGYERLWGSDDA